MTSLFNKKIKNIVNTSISKEKEKRPTSKKENIHKFIKNKKNISTLLTKYDNSQGKSGQNYTIQKTEYETAITLPSLDLIDNARDKILMRNYKPTKLTIRTNTSSKNRTISNKAMTQLSLNKNSYSKTTTKKNFKKAKKIRRLGTFQGVPIEFMEAMRLDIKSNIIRANKFIKDEKKKMVKENPNLKYYLLYQNKKMKEKNEEMRIAYEYEMEKINANRKKKRIDDYNLNELYTKLLIKENEQHFNINKPMIDKNKFNKKFMIIKKDNEEKKNYPNKNIRIIFSKLLYDKVFLNTEKKIIQLTKNLLYKKFINALKKSAIEFKNIKIPFEEYIIYYTKSLNIEQKLFNNEYSYLLSLIKKDNNNGEGNGDKDTKVSKFIDKNKFSLYIIDFFGKSVLILATRNRLYKSISKIVQNGGNVNVQDFKGRTALHFAVMNNDITAVTILLYFLANPDIKDNNGNYPLDYINNNYYYSYILKEILIRASIIRKMNKYRSWRAFDVYIRRGIQFYLYHALNKEKYELIFYYIDRPIFYYKS